MVSTLCLVMAPTMRGHTIPDNVPTPFEMPISMLAYRGAISKWLTLKPKWKKQKFIVRVKKTPSSIGIVYCGICD